MVTFRSMFEIDFGLIRIFAGRRIACSKYETKKIQTQTQERISEKRQTSIQTQMIYLRDWVKIHFISSENYHKANARGRFNLVTVCLHKSV